MLCRLTGVSSRRRSISAAVHASPRLNATQRISHQMAADNSMMRTSAFSLRVGWSMTQNSNRMGSWSIVPHEPSAKLTVPTGSVGPRILSMGHQCANRIHGCLSSLGHEVPPRASTFASLAVELAELADCRWGRRRYGYIGRPSACGRTLMDNIVLHQTSRMVPDLPETLNRKR